jgi:hypothetical protein
MPMTKRKEKRISKSLLTNISQNGFEQMGVTVNISRRGMCIATTEVFPKCSKLQILVAVGDDIYSVTGVVAWNMKNKFAAGDNVPAGLGIRIKEADPRYVHYIKAFRKMRLCPREISSRKLDPDIKLSI